MFDWLKKPDHPMYSPEEAAKLLAGLAKSEPGKALDEIVGWIVSVKEKAGFKPDVRAAVFDVLEHTGLKHHDRLLAEYLAAAQIYEVKSQQRLHKLFTFWSGLADAYLAAAAECEAANTAPLRDTLALLIARGLRAAGAAAKTRHLSYQPPGPAVWEQVFKLYAVAEGAQVAGSAVQVYKSDPLPTGPSQELLRVLMLEAAAPGRLAPEHVELAWRVTGRVASSFVIAAQPAPGLTFCVDLAKPQPPVGSSFAPASMVSPRYFGAGTAVARLEEMIKHNETDVLPTERRFGKEFSVWDKVTVLHYLALQWADPHPERRSERKEAAGDVAVLHGFEAIRKVVPQTGTSEMEAIAEAVKERQAKLSLAAEELDQVPETWSLKDMSLHGLGANAAADPELWEKPGRLCALRPAGSEAWWVGVVRRLDAGTRGTLRVGVEVLSRRPRAMWLKFVGEGQTAAANWETSSGSYAYDYLNVVMLFPEGARSMNEATLLMSPEGFVAGAVCEALMGEKSRMVRLGQPIATGDDFVIASCEWT